MTTTPPTTTEVHLAIYDLSQGMARTFSGQILGPNHVIDIIPHTSILCFNKEYFFGDGIQSMDPYIFRSTSGIGSPIQIISLGYTTRTKSQLDTWCRQNTKFTMSNYDLLNCNCNHFSHDCAIEGLQLSQGVPDWILTIPQRFLSSPMGQMIRPMLEQMQISTRSIGSRQTTTTPSTTTNRQRQRRQQQQPPPPTTTAPAINNTSDFNPWANMTSEASPSPRLSSSSSSSAAAAVPTTGSSTATSSSVSSSGGKQSSSSSAAATPPSNNNNIIPPTKPTVSILEEKYSKPLLSNDTQTISICIKKLRPHIRSENVKLTLLENKNFPSRLVQALMTAMNNNNNNNNKSDNEEEKKRKQTEEEETNNRRMKGIIISDEELSNILSELWRLLQEEIATSFVLLLLRLIVLLVPSSSTSSTTSSTVKEDNNGVIEPSFQKTSQCCCIIIKWMIQNKFITTQNKTTTTATTWKTPVERSLAWCVLSNYVAAQIEDNNNNEINEINEATLSTLSSAIDSATAELNQEQPVSVRQAAAAFLYNYILLLSSSSLSSSELKQRMQVDNDDGDGIILVSMLCSCLESLMEESDTTTRLRRMLISGRIIIFPQATAAANIISKNNNGDDDSFLRRKNNNRININYSCNNAVKDLVKDLGFIDTLQSVAATANFNDNNGSLPIEEKDCQSVASELLYRLLHD